MCKHYKPDQKRDFFVPDDTKYAPVNAEGDVEAVPYDAFPKYDGPVIADTLQGRALHTMRWGIRLMVEGKTRFETNARNDTLLKPRSVWADAVAYRRCLVPASAYYEPGTGPVGARGEVCFTIRDRPSFLMAGIWEVDPVDGKESYAVVTTEPNRYAARFHDRMPVVLSDADALRWLGREPLPRELLIELCRPCSDEIMQHVEIAAVPREKKITRADLDSGQASLF
jgi:putative SOS response-associated peptidase YedK